MQKTLDEWIEFFEKKTGEKFVRQKEFELFYLSEKGFCDFGIKDKKFVVGSICGDGKFWREFVDKVAAKCGFKYCVTTWIRKSPLAYVRFFGFKVIKKTEGENGKFDYLCVNNSGKQMTVTYDHTNKNNRDIYRVLWEV